MGKTYSPRTFGLGIRHLKVIEVNVRSDLACVNTRNSEGIEDIIVSRLTVSQKTVTMIGGFVLFHEFLDNDCVYAHIKNTFRKP